MKFLPQEERFSNKTFRPPLAFRPFSITHLTNVCWEKFKPKLFRALTSPFGKSFAPDNFQNSPNTTFQYCGNSAPDTFAGLFIKNNLIMRNLKQVSKFELLCAVLSVFFVIAVFVSCTKNIADAPEQTNEQLTSANASSNASTRTSTVAVPFENTIFVPCANGGAGESVSLTGKTNFLYQMTWTDHDFTLVYHDNYHEVTGVGLSSGETFSGSGGTNGTVMGSWVNSQWVGKMIRQVKVVGNNTVFKVNETLQLIVTPDGNVVVNAREQTVSCQ